MCNRVTGGNPSDLGITKTLHANTCCSCLFLSIPSIHGAGVVGSDLYLPDFIFPCAVWLLAHESSWAISHYNRELGDLVPYHNACCILQVKRTSLPSRTSLATSMSGRPYGTKLSTRRQLSRKGCRIDCCLLLSNN